MKYAITSSGYTLESPVENRFGRCAYIVTYDTESKVMEFIPNPFKEDEEDVGPQLVELVLSREVEKIVSGSFGIKIKPLLDSRRVQMIIPMRQGVTVGEIITSINSR
jgi:predicted Fe-Mo cluster-binding NifX family protein